MRVDNTERQFSGINISFNDQDLIAIRYIYKQFFIYISFFKLVCNIEIDNLDRMVPSQCGILTLAALKKVLQAYAKPNAKKIPWSTYTGFVKFCLWYHTMHPINYTIKYTGIWRGRLFTNVNGFLALLNLLIDNGLDYISNLLSSGCVTLSFSALSSLLQIHQVPCRISTCSALVNGCAVSEWM